MLELMSIIPGTSGIKNHCRSSLIEIAHLPIKQGTEYIALHIAQWGSILRCILRSGAQYCAAYCAVGLNISLHIAQWGSI